MNKSKHSKSQDVFEKKSIFQRSIKTAKKTESHCDQLHRYHNALLEAADSRLEDQDRTGRFFSGKQQGQSVWQLRYAMGLGNNISRVFYRSSYYDENIVM